MQTSVAGLTLKQHQWATSPFSEGYVDYSDALWRAIHSGDVPEVRLFNLGLSNPAGLLY